MGKDYVKNITPEKVKIINELLKPLLWDYSISPMVWYGFMLSGTSKDVVPMSYDASLIRVLERMAWFDLLSLFGLATLRKKLTKKIIAQLRDPLLREHYEFARQLLHKKPISSSGWRTEYRQKIRATLLSDRRYRLEPGVL